MRSSDQSGDAAPVSSADAGGVGAERSSEEWWPLWVAPWGGVLGVVTMMVIHARQPQADLIGTAMLVSMIGMVVGLIVYGLTIKLVSTRWHPRLRRGLAVISTMVAFVGLTVYFGGFLVAAMDVADTERSLEYIGLGFVVCVGWGAILFIVALLAHAAGRAETRDARIAGREATEA